MSTKHNHCHIDRKLDIFTTHDHCRFGINTIEPHNNKASRLLLKIRETIKSWLAIKRIARLVIGGWTSSQSVFDVKVSPFRSLLKVLEAMSHEGNSHHHIIQTEK